MKKRFLLLIMVSLLAVNFIACGKTEPSNTTKSTEKKEETKIPANRKSSVNKKENAKKSYINGLKKIGGTSFKMTALFSMENGSSATIQGENGTLFWMKPKKTNNLITVDYDCSNNQLNINSVAFDDTGEAQKISTIPINNLIQLSDDCKILFSSTSTQDGKELLSIEERDVLQSCGDGIGVNLRLIEIKDDGTLDLAFDDGLDGSSDDDITLDFRNHYNDFMGTNYTQKEFDELFYKGRLLTEQNNLQIYATITFQSYAGKIIAEGGDYQKVEEITSKLYGPDYQGGNPIEWGEGKFEANTALE